MAVDPEKKEHPINSREWWEDYFRQSWDEHDGGAQTQHFMERLLAELPAAERSFLRSRSLTIADWGCAFGEGVELLQKSFPKSQVTGLDFANKAIDEAATRHPNHKFVLTENGEFPGQFDVIVTSNCLEHFEYPLEVIKSHLNSCKKLYALLVPYNEFPLSEFHRSQFKEESFPDRIGSFLRLSAKVIETDKVFWPGQQILVVYGSPSYLEERAITDEESTEREKWDKYYASLPLFDADEATRAFNAELVERVSQLLPGSRILEAGCGGGWQSLALAQSGKFKVSLMDFSDEALGYARRLFHRAQVSAEFISGDVFSPGEPQFDLVFNAGVLEHYSLEQQAAFLQGMASRSRNYVLALVPNQSCYWYWLWRIQKSADGDWPFGKEVPLIDLSAAFELAGLQFLGQTFMGEQWSEYFISSLPGMGQQLANTLLGVHRSVFIPKNQKSYLLGALGSVSTGEVTAPRVWQAPNETEDMQKSVLNAALADALALRIGSEQRLRELETQVDEKDQKLLSLEKEKGHEARTLSDQISDKEQMLQALTANVSTQAQTIQSLSADISDKEQMLQALTANVSTQAQTIQSLSADISDKEQMLQALTANVSTQAQTIQSLNADLSANEQLRQTLTANLAIKEETIQSLSSQINERKQALQTLAGEHNTINQARAELQIRLAENDVALSSLLKEKEQLSQSLSEQTLEKEQAQQKLTAAMIEKERVRKSLSGQIADLDLTIKALGAEISEKELAIQKLSGRIVEQNKRLQDLTTEAEQAKHVSQQLSGQLVEKDQRLYSLIKQNEQVVHTLSSQIVAMTSSRGWRALARYRSLKSKYFNAPGRSSRIPDGSLLAIPNPIRVFDGSGLGTVTLLWNANQTSEIEIRVGAPDGKLLTKGGASGNITTPKWVADKTIFCLQNVAGGLPLTEANNLATVTVRVTSGEENEHPVLTSVDAPAIESIAQTESFAVAPEESICGIDRSNAIDIVCFPIIDWDFRFQRPQQLMRQFALAGHRVFYLAQNFRADGAAYEIQEKAPNVYEVSLRGASLNVYKDLLDDASLAELFTSLDALRRDLSLHATAAFVQLPFWSPLAARAKANFNWPVIYDCMDHHPGFSTNEQKMLDQESELISSANLVVVSSIFLEDSVQRKGVNSLLVRNACDFDHFAHVSPRKQEGERPVIGYYGAIADWFDADLVADLAQRSPDWDFLLVGSTFSAEVSRLSTLANVRMVGEKPYSEISDWLAKFDVALIPFKRIPLTEATNPVKAYEILAAGKPLVSVRLPEVVALAPLVRLAENVEEFRQQVTEALAEVDPRLIGERRAFARKNTWECRYQLLSAAVTETFARVSIIVVTFNNFELNRLCLESIYAHTEWPNFEVIVVDNASDDGTREYLKEAENTFPNLVVVLNDDNLGFAAANNIGLKLATGGYLVLLNNDTVVPRGWVTNLIRHLSTDPEIGMVGPATNEIGNEAKIPVGYRELEDMPAWARQYMREKDGQTFEIPMLAMFCVAMRREVFEQVGLLDDRFAFGMFEDDDYARRMKAKGYKIICAHDAFVHHFGRASFKLLGDKKYYDIFMQNRSLYEQKWGEMWQPHLDEGDRLRIPGLCQRLGEIVRESGVDPERQIAVFLPTIGWNNSLPQRPHHLAKELARQGYLVLFDCSGSLVDYFAGFIEIEDNLWIYNGPRNVLDTLKNAILWTVPYNVPLTDRWQQPTIIYDWIDDLSVFPYNQERLEENHRRMLEEANLVLCVARSLISQSNGINKEILYVPNGVEYHRFVSPEGSVELDVRFTRLLLDGRPVVGYYGAVASWLDVELLREVARLRRDWNFVIIGHQLPDAPSLESLERETNVLVLTAQQYEKLPYYLAKWTAAMIPFKINRITKATSPLKMYEYFAGGMPVISSAMPECQAFPEVHIIRTAQEFSAALDLAKEESKDSRFQQRLRSLARENSWSNRVALVVERLKHSSDHLSRAARSSTTVS